MDDATEAVAILLVLTPDDARPPELAKPNDARVAWTSFSILDQAKTTLDLMRFAQPVRKMVNHRVHRGAQRKMVAGLVF